MATARDVMTTDASCVLTDESAHAAAVRMADLGVGALPICGQDNELTGMIPDRDIVVKVLAAGKDPQGVHAGELAQSEAVTIGADDDVAELPQTMAMHKVRRVPVVDGHTLVGAIALADLGRHIEDPDIGLVLDSISRD